MRLGFVSIILLPVLGIVVWYTWSQFYSSQQTTTMSTPTTIVRTNSSFNNELVTLLVAGGCFWCVEADLEKLPGVVTAVSGYAGGTSTTPTYETYKDTGHREVVLVTYNPAVISYEAVMIYALKHMDPTDGEGSFYDRGLGYAPALYYDTEDERALLLALVAEIDEFGPYDRPLAVRIETRPSFYPAEDYHQDYYKGTLSGVKYQYYRRASGRDAFINKYWGTDTGPTLPWRNVPEVQSITESATTIASAAAIPFWQSYVKPAATVVQAQLDPLAYRVTQEEGTERAGSSPLDKEYGRGIYVDILSGEPLFSSRDKFDSGTGWPSFTQPITRTAVTEHEDRRLWSVRTEIRSAIADNHLGHVFPDGPRDRGGLRYCMNGVALRFIPEAEMVAAGYGDYLGAL